jgi:cytochrome oxidase Cu insertion factor (SCO1/SenC/PrrC family)
MMNSMSESHARSAQRKGRLKLLLLACLFFGPLVLAWVWYVYADRLAPHSYGNQGHLIHPARPSDGLSLKAIDGKTLPADLLQHKWSLLYLGKSPCDALCQRQLYFMRQIRTATGREMDRVQRVYLTDTAPSTTALQRFQEMHPDLQIAVLPDQDMSWQRLLRTSDAVDPMTAHRIYLLDPHGNYLMYYEPGEKYEGILKDLKRLLRISHIG